MVNASSRRTHSSGLKGKAQTGGMEAGVWHCRAAVGFLVLLLMIFGKSIERPFPL